jgi:hypothetical protein
MSLLPDGVTVLPDGSGCCVETFYYDVLADGTVVCPDKGPPIHWNCYNKVVQDHRNGDIDHEQTNTERKKRGLPVPWTPKMGDTEAHEAPIK